MEREDYRLIGRHTRTNILKGKNVRIDKDGCHVFEDYWTESEDESVESVCSDHDLRKRSERLSESCNQGLRRRSERLLIKSFSGNDKPQSKEKVASTEIPSFQSASNKTKHDDSSKYAKKIFQGRPSLKNNMSLKANEDVSSPTNQPILKGMVSSQTLNISHNAVSRIQRSCTETDAVRKELFKDSPIQNNKSTHDKGSKSQNLNTLNEKVHTEREDDQNKILAVNYGEIENAIKKRTSPRKTNSPFSVKKPEQNFDKSSRNSRALNEEAYTEKEGDQDEILGTNSMHTESPNINKSTHNKFELVEKHRLKTKTFVDNNDTPSEFDELEGIKNFMGEEELNSKKSKNLNLSLNACGNVREIHGEIDSMCVEYDSTEGHSSVLNEQNKEHSQRSLLESKGMKNVSVDVHQEDYNLHNPDDMQRYPKNFTVQIQGNDKASNVRNSSHKKDFKGFENDVHLNSKIPKKHQKRASEDKHVKHKNGLNLKNSASYTSNLSTKTKTSFSKKGMNSNSVKSTKFKDASEDIYSETDEESYDEGNEMDIIQGLEHVPKLKQQLNTTFIKDNASKNCISEEIPSHSVANFTFSMKKTKTKPPNFRNSKVLNEELHTDAEDDDSFNCLDVSIEDENVASTKIIKSFVALNSQRETNSSFPMKKTEQNCVKSSMNSKNLNEKAQAETEDNDQSEIPNESYEEFENALNESIAQRITNSPILIKKTKQSVVKSSRNLKSRNEKVHTETEDNQNKILDVNYREIESATEKTSLRKTNFPFSVKKPEQNFVKSSKNSRTLNEEAQTEKEDDQDEILDGSEFKNAMNRRTSPRKANPFFQIKKKLQNVKSSSNSKVLNEKAHTETEDCQDKTVEACCEKIKNSVKEPTLQRKVTSPVLMKETQENVAKSSRNSKALNRKAHTETEDDHQDKILEANDEAIEHAMKKTTSRRKATSPVPIKETQQNVVKSSRNSTALNEKAHIETEDDQDKMFSASSGAIENAPNQVTSQRKINSVLAVTKTKQNFVKSSRNLRALNEEAHTEIEDDQDKMLDTSCRDTENAVNKTASRIKTNLAISIKKSKQNFVKSSRNSKALSEGVQHAEKEDGHDQILDASCREIKNAMNRRASPREKNSLFSVKAKQNFVKSSRNSKVLNEEVHAEAEDNQDKISDSSYEETENAVNETTSQRKITSPYPIKKTKQNDGKSSRNSKALNEEVHTEAEDDQDKILDSSYEDIENTTNLRKRRLSVAARISHMKTNSPILKKKATKKIMKSQKKSGTGFKRNDDDFESRTLKKHKGIKDVSNTHLSVVKENSNTSDVNNRNNISMISKNQAKKGVLDDDNSKETSSENHNLNSQNSKIHKGVSDRSSTRTSYREKNEGKKHLNSDSLGISRDTVPSNIPNKRKFTGQNKPQKRSKIKECIPEQVRKSNRQRYPPLAYWRNERLRYRFEKGGDIKILGIDEGNKVDDRALKSLGKAKSQRGPQKSKKVTLYDNVYEKNFDIRLLQPYSLIPFNTDSSEKPYKIKKMVQTNHAAFGYIEIDGFQEKKAQFMPDEDLLLTVFKGVVGVYVQDYMFQASEKDMFIVPRNMAYSIKNLQKKKALLSFSVGKFRFLECCEGQL